MGYQVGVGEPWSRPGALGSKVKKSGINGKSLGLNRLFKSGVVWEEFDRKMKMDREVSSPRVRSSGRRGAYTKDRLGGTNLRGEQLGGAVKTFELRWEQIWNEQEEAEDGVMTWEETEMGQKDLGIDQKGA